MNTVRTGLPEELAAPAAAADLLVVLEHDEACLSAARELAQRTGCEWLEVPSVEGLVEVLQLRAPTLALLPLDAPGIDGIAGLRALAGLERPPTLLLSGRLDERLGASVMRLARAHGMSVAGCVPRPVDVAAAEALLTPCLASLPPLPRQELEQAVREHELVLYYQPKIACSGDTLRTRGVEALVRWQHPRRGLLAPRQFLPSFEREAMLVVLTDYILIEALRQAGQWQAGGLPLEMGVNLNPRLVRDRRLPDRLGDLLEQHGVAPERLVLDVLEASDATDRRLLLDVFTRLRLLGVGLALDNFGTGRSSLTELYQMPFTEVKIDSSLLVEVPHEREAAVVVRAIVDLARALRLTTCAEGVETQGALEYVRAVGCDALQGRLICAPAPAGEIERLLRTAHLPAPELRAGGAG